MLGLWLNILMAIISFHLVILIGVPKQLGLGFYATPSTDTAISNSPEDKVGVASGIYKMASSLGGAFGIALSGTLYGIGAMVNINFGAMLGLWLNILMAIISFTVILIGVPKQQSK